jgi:predicted XRE-type DNA-binding protein
MKRQQKAEVEGRFFDKVDIRSPDDCWDWQAATDEKGYGRFWLNGGMRLSHRVAYFLKHNEELSEEFVLHKCDNPSCVNPNHLYTGDQQDNIDDAVERGRIVEPPTLKREENPQAILTEHEVSILKWQLENTDMSQRELADIHGCSQPEISKINRGVTWSDVEAWSTQK